MKANQENNQDDVLKKVVNENFQEDGLASNFTHQLMGKIDALESQKEHKPLMTWWAWLIIAGSFVSAIVLAFLFGAFPKEEIIYFEEEIANYSNEADTYVLLALGVLTFIFVERLTNYLKLLKDLNKPSA